jgi:hypothetical protein
MQRKKKRKINKERKWKEKRKVKGIGSKGGEIQEKKRGREIKRRQWKKEGN